MKKFALYTLISFVLMSMSSCFLFQTHENCPAYGEVQDDTNKTVDGQLESIETV